MAEINFENTVVRVGTVEPEESTNPNVVLGPGSATSLASKSEGNVAIGPEALKSVKKGNSNTAAGLKAGEMITEADNTVAVGYHALGEVTTGTLNVALGFESGSQVKTGKANVFLGPYAGGLAAEGAENQLYISNSITATPLILGEFPEGKLQFNAEEMGFFKHAVVKRQKVTGNKTTEITAVLKHICEALSELGLITDETT